MKEKAGAAFGKKKNWRAKRKEKGAGKEENLGSVWGLQQLAGGSRAVRCSCRGMHIIPWTVRLRGIV